MSERPGAFVVIEGTDGSGKGTQFKLLTERLRQAGYQVATFDFPQYNQPSSYFVKEYLNGRYGSAEAVGPYTGSLFYALDRYEAAPAIRAALTAGKVVVCNRFTGSNMAHQGLKFRHAEERRGFFIWLDNLEFEMLGIPRPDISFVLRVPGDIAQSLVDQKAERSYTDKKRDLHEADLQHLERAVEVFDDLTQLFPKDFQRIDCVRGGKLLDIETVQSMLWEKVSPLLPRPNQLEMPMAAQPAPSASEDAPQPKSSEHNDTTQKITAAPYTLQSVSNVLVQKLRLSGLTVTAQSDASSHCHTPLNLAPDIRQQYQAGMDKLLVLQANVQQKLTAHVATLSGQQKQLAQAKAATAAQLMLPVAAVSDVQLSGPDDAIKETIITLLADELPEARAAGKALLAQTKLTDIPAVDIAHQTAALAALQKIATEQLPGNHTTQQSAVRLVQATPRNELDLAADMLYPHSNESLKALREQAAGWPYNRKLDIFDAYVDHQATAHHMPGQALEQARYQWDLLTSYSTMNELLALQLMPNLTWQILTPRYGFEMPRLIETAGASEEFEACFDLSLALYSLLQQAGHQAEAQYATLQGHKMRWRLTHTAGDAFRLQKALRSNTTSADLESFVIQLWQLLAEVHPIIGENLQLDRLSR